MNTIESCIGFDSASFLDEYWQKKPLLIRKMFPNFEDPLEPEELAGLAMEQACESRLIEGTDPKTWKVTQGPFTEEKFTTLPEENWTLMVQAVDQWIEAVYHLKHDFQFVPSWRLEDIMVSFAAASAGVGPHFDYYDVFIIQGLGRRSWKIGQTCDRATEVESHEGLSILKQFDTTHELILERGDVLYIPPQFAHWGVSIGRSMSYSVGCRAPSLAEILEGFSDTLIDDSTPDQRVRDYANLHASGNALIDEQSITESFNNLLKCIDNKEKYSIWFGEKVTSPKYPGLIFAPDTQYDPAKLKHELDENFTIVRNPASRFSYLKQASKPNHLSLFVDGKSYNLASAHENLVKSLCSAETLNSILLEPSSTDSFQQLILELLNQGSLVSY